MNPSEEILLGTARMITTSDKKGRRLLIRRPTALDTLRLFKAAGPSLAQNEPWLAMASLASSVMEINNVPVPRLTNEAQIETLIERLGEDGLAAIAAASCQDEEVADPETQVGNSLGTPS